MVVSLFSSFDYSGFLFIKPSFFLYFFLGSFFFVLSGSLAGVLNLVYQLKKGIKFKLVKFTFMGFFLYLVVLKLFGLVPYMFSFTSQFFFVFLFSSTFWLVMITSSFFFNPLIFFSGFSPLGSPLFLINLLNLVELVSSFMRPLTLSLRLSIKITTGHMFITLLSLFFSYSLVLGMLVGAFLILFLMFYFFFEIFVGFMQSYVFVLLLGQYYEEHS